MEPFSGLTTIFLFTAFNVTISSTSSCYSVASWTLPGRKKVSASSQIRTGVTGFKVQGANHYTECENGKLGTKSFPLTYTIEASSIRMRHFFITQTFGTPVHLQ